METNKCGEQHGRFYDRNGNFFRDGYDPYNHTGRLVWPQYYEYLHDLADKLVNKK